MRKINLWYQTYSYWIKIITALEIIVTVVLFKLNHPLCPFFMQCFDLSSMIFLVFGTVGMIFIMISRYPASKLENHEVRAFPEYIQEIADTLGLNVKNYYLSTDHRIAMYKSDKQAFVIDRVLWEEFTEQERISTMTHEFGHMIYEKQDCVSIVILILLLGKSLMFATGTPFKLYFFYFLSVFYILGSLIFWIRELRADLFSLRYVTIDVIQSKFAKYKSPQNRFTFDHPSINFRIWFLRNSV